MKYLNFFGNLTIGKKIGRSFAFLLVIISVNAAITLYTLQKGVDLAHSQETEIYPLQSALQRLMTVVKDSRSYSTNWVFMQSYEMDKAHLVRIHEETYPQERAQLLEIVELKNDTTLHQDVQTVFEEYEAILADQQMVMLTLSSPVDYEDPFAVFTAEDLIENSIVPKTEVLINQLQQLSAQQSANAKQLSESMTASFEQLRWRIIGMGILSFLFAIIISRLLSQSITRPTRTLKSKVNDLKLGKITDPIMIRRKDEMGDMGRDINELINRFKSYSDFSKEIGRGNLNAQLVVASDEDVLGASLLSMRDNLKAVIEETNRIVRLAGYEGELSTKINVLHQQDGAWRELTESINSLLGSISEPLMEVKDVVDKLAAGDLTVSYKLLTKGDVKELTDSLEMALSNMRQLMEEILQSAEIIDSSTSEMLVASKEMDSNTSEIAISIAEMSQGAQNQVMKIEESSSLAENVLRSSEAMDQKARAINGAAEKGSKMSDDGASMARVVANDMDQILKASENTLNTIRVLEDRSAQIDMVVRVISGIAQQTNLLAINAAIEAAHAGDAGRGFAVVAEEVRQLAENSKHSAQEIVDLITDVQSDSKSALSAIEHTRDLIHKCSSSTIQANNSFKEILESSQQILGLSKDILEATNYQRDDIKRMVNITESVVVIAEETAAGTEQVAASASELSSGMGNYSAKSERLAEVAVLLKSGIQRFKLKSDSYDKIPT